MTVSKSLKAWIGIAVSVVLIALLFKIADPQKLLEALSGINYLMLIPYLVITLFQYIVRAYRWRYLLPEQEQKLPVKLLLDAIMLGNFGNFVLPLRAGEFIRPVIVTKERGVKYATGFASVVTERFFDLSTVLILFGIMMFWLGSGDDVIVDGKNITGLLNAAALFLGAVALGLLFFMVSACLFPKFYTAVVEKSCSFLPKNLSAYVEKFSNEFLSGALVLNNPRRLLMVIVLSAIVWILTIIGFQSFFWIFPNMQGSFMTALVITVVIALGVAMPSAPGFLGVFQFSCIAAFALCGMDKDSGIAYSLANHAVQYMFVIVYGFYALVCHGLKFSELKADNK